MLSRLPSWIETIALILVAFFAPVEKLMGLTFLLVLADLVFGVWAAKKRGEPIESSKLRRTIGKLVAYQAAIIFGFIIGTYFITELPVVNLVSSLIGFTESKSILENLNDITGVDIFKALLTKLQGNQPNGQ